MKGYRLILGYLVAIISLVVVLLLSSCTTTKYIPVEVVRVDTLRYTMIELDSVYLHDSIYIKEWQKGDTVFMDRDRWHTQYVEKLKHDTLYQSKVDTVAVPYVVEKELTWWQEQKIKFGEIAFLSLIIVFLIIFIKTKIKW